jgi:hypothetical protein
MKIQRGKSFWKRKDTKEIAQRVEYSSTCAKSLPVMEK